MSTSIDSLQSRSDVVFWVTTITFILASIFVVARLVSRFGILESRSWDDWFIILSWFFAFGLTFAIDYATTKGLGRLDGDIKDEWRPGLKKAEYAFTLLYNPCLMATKTSILIFYLRLSKDTQKLLRWASGITLAVACVDGIVLTFVNAFQCKPVAAAWRTDGDGKCLSIITIYLASAPVNIITDLAILVLPIPVLTGMFLPQRQKAILVFTFSLGIFVAIVDVIRIYYLQQASNNFLTSVLLHSKLGAGADFPYNASLSFMWSAVEVNIGIVCACIPTLKPLVKRILPAMILDRASGRRGSRTHTTEKFESASPQSGGDVQLDTVNNMASPTTTPLGLVSDASPSPLSDTHPGGHREDMEEEELSMAEFLTAPAGFGLQTLRRNSTARTTNTTYFGFVNMRVPKSMMKTRGKEAFKYCTMVTILFFLWGFSYGLLNRLNNEIAILANYSESETIGLSAAYFGGYVIGALTVGQWVLRHSGFKATFISGLCIYGTGTLMFWPSAVLTSFTGFILSSVVVGLGLSILETAANPFLALCGPTQYAEFRLMLAQSIQAVASLVSQVLAEKALFRGVRIENEKHLTLIDVQWTYLAIALFTVILALFFYYMPLPEACDEDLQAQSDLLEIYPTRKLPWTGTSIIYTTLVFGVVSQLCYVAAQECVSEFFKPLLVSYVPSSKSFKSVFTLHDDEDYLLLGHGLFAIGRFAFAPLCLMFPPRLLLLMCFSFLTLFSAFIFAINDISPSFLAASSLLVFFFEGPIFPLVFSLTIRGMGKDTKWASAWVVASATGGSVFVFVTFGVQKIHTVQYSFVIIFVLFLVGLLYPVYLNFGGKGVRHQVDPKAMRVGRGFWNGSGGNEEDGPEMRNGSAERSDTALRRLSRRVSILVRKISPTGRKCSSELPIVEHRETRDREDNSG
ncbi:4d4500dc-d5f4-4f54-8bcd-c12e6fac5846 [Sclerotinia trifoliorum]|uniref:4d4500dc-d5f4-4f54-8bcd-c12e6fac5846 n=1 Tax=Sclerotinia trifoliorum TaxID=28548 RepID=A0A8H2VV63_9HELO|nr:4d4500dc-d5f4-4f54-8bcd-c12e6fac5846 [Sclerotinia trifoliorum]